MKLPTLTQAIFVSTVFLSLAASAFGSILYFPTETVIQASDIGGEEPEYRGTGNLTVPGYGNIAFYITCYPTGDYDKYQTQSLNVATLGMSGQWVVSPNNGVLIGPSSPWYWQCAHLEPNGPFLTYIEHYGDTIEGNFDLETPRYLAFRIPIPGEDSYRPNFCNYGWARMTVGNYQIHIYDYAIETELNTAIPAGVVPEPATIGLISFGSLAFLRRRK